MKKYLLLPIFAIALFSCSDDDDVQPVNEEETITTVTVELTSGADVVTLTYFDADGDGPGEATITGGTLMAGTTYSGEVTFLNELEDPAENITAEVREEDEEHQLFYSFADSSIATVTNLDTDDEGNPLGLTFDLTTLAAGTTDMNVVLVHEPTKPNTGVADAGGETDIEVSFPITVQ